MARLRDSTGKPDYVASLTTRLVTDAECLGASARRRPALTGQTKKTKEPTDDLCIRVGASRQRWICPKCVRKTPFTNCVRHPRDASSRMINCGNHGYLTKSANGWPQRTRLTCCRAPVRYSPCRPDRRPPSCLTSCRPRYFQFEPGHMRPTVAHPGAPGQPESRGFIAFLSLATYLRIATIAIVAQQDSLVFLGYRDAMV